MSELLTYDQVSQRFQIKKGTLAWMVHTRAIPHIRLGPRQVRFCEAELERWLRERTVRVAAKNKGEANALS